MKPKPTLDAQDVSILKLHSVLSAMTKTGREQKVLRVKKKGGWEMSARASAGERLKGKKREPENMKMLRKERAEKMRGE